MSMGEAATSHFSTPGEALLVGCWVTALPLSSCDASSFSTPLTEVVLHREWAGTPVPCMMAAHTQGNANL